MTDLYSVGKYELKVLAPFYSAFNQGVKITENSKIEV